MSKKKALLLQKLGVRDRGHPLYNPDGPGPSGCTVRKGIPFKRTFQNPVGISSMPLSWTKKRKGKDPHFGSEKALYSSKSKYYRCGWASYRPVGRPAQQRGKGLRGRHYPAGAEGIGASWQCLTLHLTGAQDDCMDKDLAEEEYDKRDSNLFGPGFLEKASKRIEIDKTTMDKVSNKQHKGSQAKRRNMTMIPVI